MMDIPKLMRSKLKQQESWGELYIDPTQREEF